MKENKYRLGIDVGGTFTDLILLNENNGDVISRKTPTIAEDPTRGVTNGLSLLKEMGIAATDIALYLLETSNI